MKLKSLLTGENYKILAGEEDVEIKHLSFNSKEILKNSIFFCIKGVSTDGHKYINEAIKNGAKAIVLSDEEYLTYKEKDLDLNEQMSDKLKIKMSKNLSKNKNRKKADKEEDQIIYDKSITIIKVKDARATMSLAARNFYGNSFSYKIIGITGTNGKTTSTFMLKSILRTAKKNVAIIGTSGIFFNEKQLKGEELTTPDPIDLFYWLNFFNKKIDFLIFEVSAHALYYDKIKYILSDVAIFTNISEDHLDFFHDMENYANSKFKYFEKEYSKLAIINIDDEYGNKLYKNLENSKLSFGKSLNSEFIISDTENYKFKLKFAQFNSSKRLEEAQFSCISKLKTMNKNRKFVLTMPGEYNAYNATGVIIAAFALGFDYKIIYKGLKNLPLVSGRYNVFDIKKHGKVILDFAHTPDGLEKVLTATRKTMKKNAKLISLFGCGGNRDVYKRPIMGKIASEIADFVIISIDNPRYEDPYKVMNDIAKGIEEQNRDNYKIVMPRKEAIRQAILMCGKDDRVVVSGKGTEPYYEVNGVKQEYHEEEIIKGFQKRIK